MPSTIPTPLIVVGGVLVFVLLLLALMIHVAQKRQGEDDGPEGKESWFIRRFQPGSDLPTPGTSAPPFGIMPDGFNGVSYRLGKIKRTVKSGLYFRLPGIYRLTYVSVQDDVVDMPIQSILIESGASIEIRWSLVIRVTEPRIAILTARDYKTAVREFALQFGATELSGYSLEELAPKVGGTADEMTAGLNEVLGGYGVEAVSFRPSHIEMSPTLKEATEQVIKARLDAEADLINAEREVKLAEAYLKAAKKYHEQGGELSEGAIAMRLRELGSFEDMRGASILLSESGR